MIVSTTEKVPDLSGTAYAITDLGRTVLAEYADGAGPLANEDVDRARQRFAAAALAEMHVHAIFVEQELEDVSV